MLMLNILCVLIYFLLACVAVRVIKVFNHKLDSFVSTHNATVQATDDRFINVSNRLTHIEAKLSLVDVGNDRVDDDINKIIARLNAITEDIARIDRDEKDLRTYYVNYREPAHPNGGVNWSETVKVTEDDE